MKERIKKILARCSAASAVLYFCTCLSQAFSDSHCSGTLSNMRRQICGNWIQNLHCFIQAFSFFFSLHARSWCEGFCFSSSFSSNPVQHG